MVGQMRPHEVFGLYAHIERRQQTYDFPKGGHATKPSIYEADTPRELRLELTELGVRIEAKIGGQDHQNFTLSISWATLNDLMARFNQEAQRLASISARH